MTSKRRRTRSRELKYIAPYEEFGISAAPKPFLKPALDAAKAKLPMEMTIQLEYLPGAVETLPDGTRLIHSAKLTGTSQVRDVRLDPDGSITLLADRRRGDDSAGRQEP